MNTIFGKLLIAERLVGSGSVKSRKGSKDKYPGPYKKSYESGTLLLTGYNIGI